LRSRRGSPDRVVRWPKRGSRPHEPPGALAEARPILRLEGQYPQTGFFGLAYDATVELTPDGGGLLRAALDPESLSADWPFQVAGPSSLHLSAAGLPPLEGQSAISAYLWQPGIDRQGYYSMFDHLQDAPWGDDW
jgi:hypothetical protein